MSERAAMAVLTESALFGSAGVPLTVREQTARTPSGPVTAESVKVVFCISGWARVECAAGSLDLEPGTILTIPPGVECAGFQYGHARTVTFYLGAQYASSQLRWLPRVHPLVHQLHRSLDGTQIPGRLQVQHETMRGLGLRLLRTAELASLQASEFAMLSAVSEVFELVGRTSGATRTPPQLPTCTLVPRQEVRAAVAMLRHHPEHPWRIEELARRVALSSSQMTRLFRDQMGVSPAAYLSQTRADRMAELLATQRLSVIEAAHKAGWPNPTVAARVFKRRYGVSPRAFAASFAQHGHRARAG